MNNNISTDDHAKPNNHSDVGVLFGVILICLLTSGFNLFTIAIIFISKKLRRPANYAIASFLFASALQAMIAAPVYIVKKLQFNHGHQARWPCDTFRMAYFICGHTMKVSLLIVSFDRLVAIKYPYKYKLIFTKRIMAAMLLLSWLCILGVDLIPFLLVDNKPDAEGCKYIPSHEWSICVIFFFNIFPFVFIAINYILLWIVAVKIALKDVRQEESLYRNKDSDSNILDILPENCCDEEQCNSSIHNDDNLNANTEMQCYYRRQKSYKKAVLPEPPGTDITKNCYFSKESTSSSQRSCISFMRRRTLVFLIEMKATRTSLMLLALYLVCWGPLGIFYMIDQFCAKCLSETLAENLEVARFAVKILCFVSSPLAPLVYCWRTREFRKETCKIICKKRSRRKWYQTYSRSSQAEIHSVVRRISMAEISPV